MLFNFLPNSNESNWFQDFLIGLVKEVLRAKSLDTKARAWKDVVVGQHSDALRRKRGLKSRYETLCKAAETLPAAEAQQFLDCLELAGYYKDVLTGAVAYMEPPGMTADLKEAIKSLFEFGFELLSDLQDTPIDGFSIRDGLYRRAYHAMPGHFCPFCGIDRFDAPHPDMPRHALDHYLAISIYPLFGAHLPNLVPMCGRCNSSFKLAADMLRAVDGSRRVCVDPYGDQVAKVSLMNSEPFGGGENGQLPKWVIDFDPATDAFETWDDVFSIRLRYKESVLDAEYKAWLQDFARWAEDSQLAVTNGQEASAALKRWAALFPDLNDQGFIKRPVFEMLAASALRADVAGSRVTNLVKALCAM
ncbi:hypothetical protein [Burkholderia gladioli]|uniref:hypothetical protein n=1 Tax=Burkholderia gladioli TaxID=28095 RepID=UPI003B97EACA